MIYPIYVYGRGELRKVSEDIGKDYPDLSEFIASLWETLKESDGIGLAAPQVGRHVRVLVIDLNELKDKYPEYTGFRKVYVNAHILEYDESEMSTLEEGCLSLPGIHENVKRPVRVRVKYVDEDFTPHEEWVDGYLARVLQHEVDHLEGVVFSDRVSPLRRQLIQNKLKALVQGKVKCDYKVKVK